MSAQPRLLVFQHHDVEHPGRFRELWLEAGIHWESVKLDAGESIPELEPFDALIVMGGPMDVWQEQEHPWLVAEKAAIRRWVADMQRPFLGICLGHQLLADALGGEVGPAARPEVGLAEVTLTADGVADPLFFGFPAMIETFQWHGAEVQRLPDGSTVLASNAACAVQSFRWREHAYGIQYHCEITEKTVGEWQALPAYAVCLKAAVGSESVAKIEAETAARLPAFSAAATRLNDNFLRIVASARSAAIKRQAGHR